MLGLALLKSANDYSFKPSVVKACRNHVEELQKSDVAEASGSLVQLVLVQGPNTWRKGENFLVGALLCTCWGLELLPDHGPEPSKTTAWPWKWTRWK